MKRDENTDGFTKIDSSK